MNLNQITIPVINVERSIKFYKLLGLELIVHTHENYARFVCNPGATTFSLHRVDSISEGPRTVIYFEREDLDDYVKVLEEKGVHFDQQPQDQKWLWKEAKLHDPDQNPIILYKAGDNRLNPPWRIQNENFK